MSNWKDNNREESKPSWLTPAQKINCVRTVRGWEIPLHGTNLGGAAEGTKGVTGMTAFIPHTELIVAMGSNGTTGIMVHPDAGFTFGTDNTSNYRPYITTPFQGASATDSNFTYNGATGLSFATSATAAAGATGYGHYGVGPYGVSTLNFPGSTAYIKIVANDSNFTQNITFSLPSVAASDQQFGQRANIYQGSALINGTIPIGIYEAFFGPTAAVNNNIAVVQIAKGGATANQHYRMTVAAADNGTDGLTAHSTFTVSFGATATS